jgi:hypothetical protein
MYQTPLFLSDIANNMIGRAILVISLAFIIIRCDFSCAILFSLIIIVLLHNSIEGFVENLDVTEVADGVEKVNTEMEEEEDLDADADADADADEDADADADTDASTEPFIGGLLKKNLNKARRVLRTNITDLDRELKVGAERRSISATKQ